MTSMSASTEQSRFSLLTGTGRGAVGVVWIGGPLAVEALQRCFHPMHGKTVQQRAIGSLSYGQWDYSQVVGLSSEDVVVLKRGHDEFEVHIHGGTQSKESLRQTLVAGGLEEMSPEEWLSLKSSSALAVVVANCLLRCETEKIAKLLLGQERAWRRLVECMQSVVRRRSGAELAQEADSLLARQNVADHLTRPWKVVLAGPPNVGKSSLINSLCGFERAIVHRTPGTTRDVVTQRLVVNGWSVDLADTAGQRETVSEVEAAGIIRARDVWKEADCRIAVRDASGGEGLAAWDPAPDLVVANKVDVSGAKAATGEWPVSAIRGVGIAELQAAVIKQLVPEEPGPGSALPIDVVLACLVRELGEAGRRGDFATSVKLLKRLAEYCGHPVA